MRTTDFCFPLLRLRVPVPRYVTGISSKLAPRPLAREPALAARRPVDLAFHDARSASADSLGLARGLFLPALPIEPYL